MRWNRDVTIPWISYSIQFSISVWTQQFRFSNLLYLDMYHVVWRSPDVYNCIWQVCHKLKFSSAPRFVVFSCVFSCSSCLLWFYVCFTQTNKFFTPTNFLDSATTTFGFKQTKTKPPITSVTGAKETQQARVFLEGGGGGGEGGWFGTNATQEAVALLGSSWGKK